VLCTGSGSWVSHVEFEGKAYWTIDDRYPEWEMPTSDE